MERRENLRRWRLSRRRFLQIAAGSGVAAAAAGLAPAIARGGNGEPDSESEQPRRLRKWMMVIDLRRCDGCQSQGTAPQCTEACIAGHFVPEPMQWIEVYEHELSADAERLKAQGKVSPEMSGTRFMPTPCMQCQNPPCVNVCPVGATWSTPEGIVLIDQHRCIGCRMCMAACPYERRFFTWSQPAVPPASLFVEYSPEHQVPLPRGVVAKCDFCPEMARAGRLPFCAQACPQNAIYYGDFEEGLATNGKEVVRLDTFLADNNAFQYKEEKGTRPRVHYIPGHGEAVGRDPNVRGLKPVEWKYGQKVEGGRTWKRSGR